VEEVKLNVDEASTDDLTPHLVEGGYWGFDIIECGPQIYALAQGQGPFDLEKFERKEYERCVIGDSVDEVKKQVDNIAIEDLTPRLRETGYWGYNLIECARRIYALGQDEGAFDYDKAQRGEYKRCYIADSVQQAKQCVDEAMLESARPILRESGFHRFNLIEYGTRFYALAQTEGEFDFQTFKAHQYRRCYSASSMDELKKYVEVATSSSNVRARLLSAWRDSSS